MFDKKHLRITYLLSIALVLVACGNFSAPTSAPAQTPIPEPTPIPRWDQSGFSRGGSYPVTITGPAIAEFVGPVCALVRFDEGESLWSGFAVNWWRAESQEILERRWPQHVVEYELNYSDRPECEVFEDPVNFYNSLLAEQN